MTNSQQLFKMTINIYIEYTINIKPLNNLISTLKLNVIIFNDNFQALQNLTLILRTFKFVYPVKQILYYSDEINPISKVSILESVLYRHHLRVSAPN